MNIFWNTLRTIAMAAVAGLMLAPDARSQAMRPEQTVFLKPSTGMVSYMGDNSRSLVSFDGAFPFQIGLEAGYDFRGPWSVGGGYTGSRDVRVTSLAKPDLRHTFDLVGRHSFGGVTGLAPYVQAGAFISSGEVPVGSKSERRTAYGPSVGFGLDLPASNRVSVYFESNVRASMLDDAMDGYDSGKFGNFDLYNSLGAGLKINMRPGFVGAFVDAIAGPEVLYAGSEGTFSAVVNRATEPVRYTWSFGDGQTASGVAATHAFSRTGTYTVRFTAANRFSSTKEMTVRVIPAPVPASVVGITADPSSPDTETPVRFMPETRGDGTLSFAWSFGDGSTSTERVPSHTFTEPGSYSVMLRLENEFGADERSISLRVRPFEAEICSEVFDMNSAMFENNSSALTAAARRLLVENVGILKECPNMTARVEGYAAPNERQPQALSEARARTVEAFYVEEGIGASRLDVAGRGAPGSTTSKKDGADRYRRVDTTPIK